MTVDGALRAIRSIPRRFQLIGATAILVLIAGAIVAAALSHAPRAALFAEPLRPDQISEVQEQLAQWNVAFTPISDNVVVDTARRNEVLLRLSLAGVPHAHVANTTEALASIGALTPQAVIDAQTRSGLAGDIELAIRSIAGIDDVRVIIAPAKTAEFADESARDASASVRLVMHPGAALSPASVAGIRAFVAASVAGLDAPRVTILDDRGVALADRAVAGDEAEGLQRSLQSALDAALGAGVAIVRIHAEYGRSITQTRDVRRVPLGDVPLERNATSETYSDAAKHYQKSDEHDDRGSETRETLSQSEPGAIARVSTAVIVDEQRSFDVGAVRALAAAIVGYNPRRGDTLEVQMVSFHHAPDVRRDGWFLAYGAIVPLLPSLVVAIVVLLAARSAAPEVVKFVSTWSERAATARTSRTVVGYAPAQVRGALAHEPPHSAAAIISALPAATAAAVLELYPQHEREAIVKRMQRAHTHLVPDLEEILARHA